MNIIVSWVQLNEWKILKQNRFTILDVPSAYTCCAQFATSSGKLGFDRPSTARATRSIPDGTNGVSYRLALAIRFNKTSTIIATLDAIHWFKATIFDILTGSNIISSKNAETENWKGKFSIIKNKQTNKHTNMTIWIKQMKCSNSKYWQLNIINMSFCPQLGNY